MNYYTRLTIFFVAMGCISVFLVAILFYSVQEHIQSIGATALPYPKNIMQADWSDVLSDIPFGQKDEGQKIESLPAADDVPIPFQIPKEAFQ